MTVLPFSGMVFGLISSFYGKQMAAPLVLAERVYFFGL